jgi:hypothetical protein
MMSIGSSLKSIFRTSFLSISLFQTSSLLANSTKSAF